MDWEKYEPAIKHWESTLGRHCPAPAYVDDEGYRRVAARLLEWMMGQPSGWVTDTEGLSRNDEFTMLGNGVVTQQAVAALRLMLNQSSKEA